MTIDLEHKVIGTIAAGPLFGTAALGFTRVRFQLGLSLGPLDTPRAYLTDFLAEIFVTLPGRSPVPIGRAQPYTSWVPYTRPQAKSYLFELWLDLSGEQLEALEQRRAGQGLEFDIDLHLQIRQGGAIHPARTRVRVYVTQSHWAEVLRQVGYLDHLLVAEELPIDASEQIRTAVQHVRAAHQHLIAGRYSDSVGVCRRAMESLPPLTDDAKGAAIRTAFAEARKKMTMGQRAELVRMAVHHFANPTHLEEPGKPAEVYSRQDALFILTAAAGVVWEALGRHREASAGPSSPQGASAS